MKVRGYMLMFCFLFFASFSPAGCQETEKKQDALLKPMEPYGGFIRKLDIGKQIWTKHSPDAYRWPVKRDHTFSYLPEFLKGKGYILSPMRYSEALVEKAGYVYVITPTPVEENASNQRFSKSVAGMVVNGRKPPNLNVFPCYISLTEQGFERMEDIAEFKLSETVKETVAVYRKYAEKGEIIRYGNPGWGVTVAGLPDDYKTTETEETKEIEFVKTPAETYINPGKEYALCSRTYQGLPGIEITPKGRLWATWVACNCGVYTEGPRNYWVLVTSDDGGKTWSDPPRLAVQHPIWTIASIDAVPWHDPSGRLWLFWTQYDVPMDKHNSWGMVTENPESENPRWSKPQSIGKGTMLNKPTALSTGEWLYCSSIRGNPVDVYISTDKGKTVTHFSEAVVPKASWNEHMIVERKDGSLWMLVRSYGDRTGISQTFSYDRGKTWTEGEFYRPGAGSRFHIRRLKSGRLLLIAHPEGEKNSRVDMTAYLSEDEGKTWPYHLLLYKGGCSAPDAVEADDGTIYAVHDAERLGKISGRWVGRMQIILSVFTEEDIMAGKPVSKNSRLGVAISSHKMQ